MSSYYYICVAYCADRVTQDTPPRIAETATVEEKQEEIIKRLSLIYHYTSLPKDFQEVLKASQGLIHLA